jgi:predicted PhzF superfamily epimerase YddE/YHI9
MTKGAREALGLRPESFWLATKAMAVLEDPAVLRALKPDLGWVKTLPSDGLIVTAPGDMDGVDFVSRYFAPHAGIDEDPVTGSAHCTLVPYWAERLQRSTLQAYQASSRGGHMSCRLEGERVFMAGQARLYLEGEAHVDA